MNYSNLSPVPLIVSYIFLSIPAPVLNLFLWLNVKKYIVYINKIGKKILWYRYGVAVSVCVAPLPM